jgi:hypothetical protein
MGVYPLSTTENSRAAAWSPSKNRFLEMNKEKEEMPGPGEYNQSDYQQGIYILSKFKNYGAIKYRKQTKRLSNDFLRKINNCKFYA